VRKAGLGLVRRLGRLTRPHEHVGHREHGRNGQDLVGTPERQAYVSITAARVQMHVSAGLEDRDTMLAAGRAPPGLQKRRLRKPCS
jgi:hypothetical protein